MNLKKNFIAKKILFVSLDFLYMYSLLTKPNFILSLDRVNYLIFKKQILKLC